MRLPSPNIPGYQDFVNEVARYLGCNEIRTTDILWHYTKGESLVEIIGKGDLWATHVSCLNDSSELLYANRAYVSALEKVPEDFSCPEYMATFRRLVLDRAQTYPTRALANRAQSLWYVACLSSSRNDLSQWRAYTVPDNGFAIGLSAGQLLNSKSHDWLIRVCYSESHQTEAARLVAEATFLFFR